LKWESGQGEEKLKAEMGKRTGGRKVENRNLES
jgi:hypothetical protein